MKPKDVIKQILDSESENCDIIEEGQYSFENASVKGETYRFVDVDFNKGTVHCYNNCDLYKKTRPQFAIKVTLEPITEN